MKDEIIAIGLTMIGLLVLSAQTPAHADNICSQVVNRVRAGEADGPVKFGNGLNMVMPVLASRAGQFVRLDSHSESAVAEVLTNWRATPALMKEAKAQFGDNFDTARVDWLGSSGAAAIKATAGIASCIELLFFDTSGGHAHEIAPPAGMSFGEGTVCWNSLAWIGMVGSVPALMEDEESNGGANARLTIVPWWDHRWEQICQITASFATPLAAIGASCRNGTDCNAMQKAAFALARAVQAGMSENEATKIGTANIPQSLNDLASKTPELDQLPTFGNNPLAPYTTFASKKLFALTAIGAEELAVIGSGSWGWRDFPGYLVSIWRPAGDVLEPVAGFQLLRQRGKIVSVKAERS